MFKHVLPVKMRRILCLGAIALLLLPTATPAAAGEPPDVRPPAAVERVSDRNFPICLTPTPLVFGAEGGRYSGQIVLTPIMDPAIMPHGQMENSRFDVTWAGDLVLGFGPPPDRDCQLFPPFLTIARASGQVSGRIMLQLHPPLPNDPTELTIPGVGTIPVGFPVTPYSVSIVMDEPVQVLPDLLPPLMVRQLKITKGELLFFK